MKLRSRLAITCAKGTSALIKKLNRGSGVTLPGYVARLIQYFKRHGFPDPGEDDRYHGN